MLRGAIRENPRDAEAWLALGNALTAAGEGVLTPAAQYAYRRAEQLAPESPGVPFFVGVAQLQANNLLDARMLWDQAARRAPEGSEERAEIAARVARLDTVLQQIVAAREAQGAPAE
jgi:cytochrome c-type biogenesis protein CcmH